MGETIKNEVNIIIKTLNSIVKSNELLEHTELFLGKTFTSIETHVKLNTFFRGIEWELSDIKTSEYPNWKTNIPPIIEKIRKFMLEDEIKNVKDEIKNVKIKIKNVKTEIKKRKLRRRGLEFDKHTLEKFNGS